MEVTWYLEELLFLDRLHRIFRLAVHTENR